MTDDGVISVGGVEVTTIGQRLCIRTGRDRAVGRIDREARELDRIGGFR